MASTLSCTLLNALFFYFYPTVNRTLSDLIFLVQSTLTLFYIRLWYPNKVRTVVRIIYLITKFSDWFSSCIFPNIKIKTVKNMWALKSKLARVGGAYHGQVKGSRVSLLSNVHVSKLCMLCVEEIYENKCAC